MKLEVDPTHLRGAADQLRNAADQTHLAHLHASAIGPPQPWAADLKVQASAEQVRDALREMTAVAAQACADLVADLESAAHGYEATEIALSGRERIPE